MAASIYEELWNIDENRFTVSPCNEDGEHLDPEADILLDEQVQADGRRSVDLAERPLFARVNEDKLLSTHDRFLQLLDNYVANFREDEVETQKEHDEIDAFVDGVLATRVAERAREWLRDDLGEDLTREAFRAVVRRLWFQMYTNHFRGKSDHFCTGFEHVFVGEAKFDTRFGGRENLGEVSGYHSWIKFYLDERHDRVDFHGYKYDLRGGAGPDNPAVATIQFTHELRDLQGNVLASLFKRKGGFFVGPSPECEMILGTVAFYEHVHGRAVNERLPATINGGRYRLTMYRSTNPDQSPGLFVRSFYPIYEGMEPGATPGLDPTDVLDRPVLNYGSSTPAGGSGGTGDGGVGDGGVGDHGQTGPVVVAAALPNPAGDDIGHEWVEIRNVGDEAVDLAGWQLRDRNDRPEPLEGLLEPGEVLRVIAERASPGAMQMGNRAGEIRIHDRSGALVGRVAYEDAASGHVLRFWPTAADGDA